MEADSGQSVECEASSIAPDRNLLFGIVCCFGRMRFVDFLVVVAAVVVVVAVVVAVVGCRMRCRIGLRDSAACMLS